MWSSSRPLEAIQRHSQSVQIGEEMMYTDHMDVAVTELRAHLSDWLEKAQSGEEIVVTDRGVPIARLLGLNSAATLQRLTLEGVISRPALSEKIKAGSRRRPSPTSSVSDLLSSQRR
jgi:prevent-host-death family protein